MGFLEHTTILKKLFKGVQQQINSVLQFSLKYYGRKNGELKNESKGNIEINLMFYFFKKFLLFH